MIEKRKNRQKNVTFLLKRKNVKYLMEKLRIVRIKIENRCNKNRKKDKKTYKDKN